MAAGPETRLTAGRGASRKKVKTGCKTCKIRKVKCDEGRPACHRCVSTGRKCDGYGIWGGGSNCFDQHQRTMSEETRPPQLNPLPSEVVAIVESSQSADRYFEWFKCRTSKKVPGIFLSSFWDTLVIQASMSEPSVLNAVLTLSAVHKREISTGDEPLDNQERFMLRHYNQAIRDLQMMFVSEIRNRERLTLMGCVVFVSLELLRGHFGTGLSLLRHGLQIQQGLKVPSSSICSSHDPLNDLTIGALSRLQFQATLLHQIHPSSTPIPIGPTADPTGEPFYSVIAAWQELENSFNSVFELSNAIRQGDFPGTLMPDVLIAGQQKVQMRLIRWQKSFQASEKYLEIPNKQVHERAPEDLVKHWLQAYHTMAVIMAKACLYPYDESVYDKEEGSFAAIIEHASHIWGAMSFDPQVRALPGRSLNMANSIIDLGWIPFLYYTAVKCRVPSIRQQAIRYLTFSSHREGIFDANLLACIGKKLMEIETPNFQSSNPEIMTPRSLDADSPEWGVASTGHNDLRAHNLQVDLPDGPADTVKMSYVQHFAEEGWCRSEQEYCLASQTWHRVAG